MSANLKRYKKGDRVTVKVNKEYVDAVYDGWSDKYGMALVVHNDKVIPRKIYELNGGKTSGKPAPPVKQSRFDVDRRFDFISEIVDMVITGESKSVIISGSGGLGKCSRRGDRILMHDVSIKKVEDIIVGDLLMGDDGQPREVLSLARGRDQMYEVHPTKGDSFCVNGEHILCLKSVGANGWTKNIHEITMNEYLSKTPVQKENLLLYHVGVNFKSQKITIDPYWLGLWLGDGSSNSAGLSINSVNDPEILNFHTEYTQSLGLDLHRSKQDKRYDDDKCRVYTPFTRGLKLGQRGRGSNVLLNMLRSYELSGPVGSGQRKRIPLDYIRNSRKTRLQVLAGLIDSDGGSYGGGVYEILSKWETLADDIALLARSLGYLVTRRLKKRSIKSVEFTGYYHDLIISGAHDLPSRLPRKQTQGTKNAHWKDNLRTGFKVVPVGEDDYFGFTITGNGRFLMHDFLVTHNTYTVMERLQLANLTNVDDFEENEGAEELDITQEILGDFALIKGFSTPKALYRLLWTHKDRILIFDDCDSIWRDDVSVGLLKCALDSYETRRIHWHSEIRDDSDLPQVFEFCGKVIFVSNLSLTQLDQAVLSRCLYVDVTMTPAEKIQRIKTVLPNIRTDMPDEMKQEAVELIEQHKDNIGDLNIRTALKVLEIRHAHSAAVCPKCGSKNVSVPDTEGPDRKLYVCLEDGCKKEFKRKDAFGNWRDMAEYVITAF